jgi:tetratricopeptide (TPR) repeat protein
MPHARDLARYPGRLRVLIRFAAALPLLLLLSPGRAGADDAAVRRESVRPDAAVHLARALEYLERPGPEDQAHAEALFRKALDLDPDLAAAHAGLARVATYLYTLGLDETGARLEGALDSARRAVASAPADGPSRAALALALAAADRLTPALEEARRAVDLAPDDTEAHVALSVVLRLRGEREEAVDAGRRAAALEPWSPRVTGVLASALREAEQYESALELYGQAVDLDPASLALQLGAAATLQQASRSGTAFRLYGLLRREWGYGGRRIAQGEAALLLRTGDHAGALAIYDSVDLLQNSSLPTLLMLYGKGYCLLQLDRPAEAEYFLSTLIERVPPDYDGPVRGRELVFRAYGDLAAYFASRGRRGRAEELLAEAAGRAGAPARIALGLADLLDGTDRIGEAAEALERSMLLGDPADDPLDLAAAAIRLVRIRTRGGERALGSDGAAARALETAALRIAPSRLGVAHYRLARAQALAGDAARASDSLARGRENGYLPIEQLQSEPDFDPIRNDPRFRRFLDGPAAPAGRPGA